MTPKVMRNHFSVRLLELARPFRPSLPVALFILTVCVLIAVLSPLHVRGFNKIETLDEVLLAALLFGVLNPLGIWAGLGTPRWIWRILGLLLGFAMLAAIIRMLWPPGVFVSSRGADPPPLPCRVRAVFRSYAQRRLRPKSNPRTSSTTPASMAWSGPSGPMTGSDKPGPASAISAAGTAKKLIRTP